MPRNPVVVAVVFSPVLLASPSMAQTSDVPLEPAPAVPPAPPDNSQAPGLVEPPPPASTPQDVPLPTSPGPEPEHPLLPEPIHAEEERPFVLSLRGSLGLGGGSLGFGGRIGLAGERWLTDAFAIGGTITRLGQTSAGFLGPGTDSSAWLFTPVVGLRSSATGGYFFGTLGAGYALVTRTELRGLCLNFGGGGCAPNQSTGYNGYGITAAVGWLGHPGRSGFEIGPVLRLEAVGDFRHEQPVDSLVTLNLELGVAALRPR